MIADLIRETGEARAVDLAKHFGVTGPTVNSIIRRLVREGLVESRPYRSIFLTEKGKLLADYCKKRHEIVYNFLIKIGVNEKVAKNITNSIVENLKYLTTLEVDSLLKKRKEKIMSMGIYSE